MEPSVVDEIFDELLPSFEALETQSGAILQFLKDKGIATDKELAPYLEQARSASEVRWRAARLRMNRVLAPAFKTTEMSADTKSTEKKRSESATKGTERQSEATQEQSSGKEPNKQEDSQVPKQENSQASKKETADAKKDAAAFVEKDTRKSAATERSNKDAA